MSRLALARRVVTIAGLATLLTMDSRASAAMPDVYDGWKLLLLTRACPIAETWKEGGGVVLPLLRAVAPVVVEQGVELLAHAFESAGKAAEHTMSVRAAEEFYAVDEPSPARGAAVAPAMKPCLLCTVIVRGRFGRTPDAGAWRTWGPDQVAAFRDLHLVASPEFYLELKITYSKDGRMFRFVPVFFEFASPLKPRFLRSDQRSVAVRFTVEGVPNPSAAEMVLSTVAPPVRLRTASLEGLTTQWLAMPKLEAQAQLKKASVLRPATITATVVETLPESDLLLFISRTTSTHKDAVARELKRALGEKPIDVSPENDGSRKLR